MTKKDFFEAVGKGDVRTIRKELDRGKNAVAWKDGLLGKETASGKTLVDIAVESGKKDVLGMFLCHAVVYQPDAVDALIASGVDVKSINNKGKTPLYLALSERRWTVLWDEPKIEQRGYRDKQMRASVVKKLVEAGADVNDGFANETSLKAALISDSICETSYLQILLDAGADVLVHDRTKQGTVLDTAARSYPEALPAMLDALARKNPHAALVYSASYLLSAIRKYVDMGADVDSCLNEFGKKTPLMFAVLNGDEEFVRFLIEKGADRDRRDDSGQTPVHAAIKHLPKMFPELVTKESIEKDKNKGALLHLATEAACKDESKIAFVELILSLVPESEREAYVNTTSQSFRKETALSMAADCPRLVKILIDAGAVVNVQDSMGYTPLANAVKKSAESTRILLENGAWTDLVDNSGRTALAAGFSGGGCTEALHLLAKYSGKKGHGKYGYPSINIADEKGFTALMRASDSSRDADFASDISTLLAAGASMNARLEDGRTSLSLLLDYALLTTFADSRHEAKKEKRLSGVEVLLDSGITVSPMDFELASKHIPEALPKLVDRLAKTNVAAALRMAAAWYPKKILELVEVGADVNGESRFGTTPLMHAAESSAEATRILLGIRGVDVDAKDSRGRTALHYAVGAKNSCVGAVNVEALVAAGASVDECDERGESPIRYVCKNILGERYPQNTKDEKRMARTLVEAGCSVNGALYSSFCGRIRDNGEESFFVDAPYRYLLVPENKKKEFLKRAPADYVEKYEEEMEKIGGDSKNTFIFGELQYGRYHEDSFGAIEKLYAARNVVNIDVDGEEIERHVAEAYIERYIDDDDVLNPYRIALKDAYVASGMYEDLADIEGEFLSDRKKRGVAPSDSAVSEVVSEEDEDEFPVL